MSESPFVDLLAYGYFVVLAADYCAKCGTELSRAKIFGDRGS